MSAFHYTGRKAGEIHIVPSAPFSLNDGGRQHSKRPRQRNDCTVRAIAIVCGFSYDSAYELLKAHGRKCSRGIRLRPLLEGALLNEYRFKWTAFPAVKGYLRMYPGDFCRIFPRGRWIIKTARHVSAVVDGTIPASTAPGSLSEAQDRANPSALSESIGTRYEPSPHLRK